MGSRKRVAAVLTTVSLVAFLAPLGAQTRVGGGARPHDSLPAARRPRPSSIGQFPTAAPFPGLRPGGRRPAPCRSSILGLVLFDPYWWWDSDAWNPEAGSGSAPGAVPVGGVQLDVDPRRALVFVDGLVAGLVEDFSGYYHHLNAPAGVHVIDIAAPDYEPLRIEVIVSAGQTTTYRGSLNRAYGRD
jgi:hypothetical protein